MAEIKQEFYHGWTIQIAPAQAGYTFQCWMAERQISIADTQCYTTVEQALGAGRLRADLESVRLSLTAFVRSKLQLLCLNSDEQHALERSIAQYIDAAKHQFS